MSEEEPDSPKLSVVIPCFNEENSIENTVSQIFEQLGQCDLVLVNDGSTDGTSEILASLEQRFESIRIISHSVNRGYGAALKSGIRSANHDLIAITDADGTYPISELPNMVAKCREYDMVVGSRTGKNVSYSSFRKIPKAVMKRWVSWITRTEVPDINSGMRVFKKSVFDRFEGLFPDGFSFTLTITLACLTNHIPTHFHPIDYYPRKGESKISPVSDTLKFLILILRTGAYFAPMRVFTPICLFLMGCAGLSLFYDIFVIHDLTDKTILLSFFAFNILMYALIIDMIDKRVK